MYIFLGLLAIALISGLAFYFLASVAKQDFKELEKQLNVELSKALTYEHKLENEVSRARLIVLKEEYKTLYRKDFQTLQEVSDLYSRILNFNKAIELLGYIQ